MRAALGAEFGQLRGRHVAREHVAAHHRPAPGRRRRARASPARARPRARGTVSAIGTKSPPPAASHGPSASRVHCAQCAARARDPLLREARLRERAVHLVARLVGGRDHLRGARRGQRERRGLAVVAAHEHAREVGREVGLARERSSIRSQVETRWTPVSADARDRVPRAHAREERMRIRDRLGCEQLGRIRAAERRATQLPYA
jgi:hypothetical protein